MSRKCGVSPRLDHHGAYKFSYYAYMGSLLQVRDVPEDARRTLKARAASCGQSLNSYMLDVIEREVARPTVAEVLARAAERTERASASALDVLDAARRDRDEQLMRRVGA
jgi:plasmid stability protein